eukprot:jgi/Tetstr1/446177/TSEL_003578.t1
MAFPTFATTRSPRWVWVILTDQILTDLSVLVSLPKGSDGRHADVGLFGYGGIRGNTVAVDTTIAPILGVSTSDPTTALRAAERHKIQKYDEGVRNAAGMLRFVPFAVSEFGSLAPHAEAFLTSAATPASAPRGHTDTHTGANSRINTSTNRGTNTGTDPSTNTSTNTSANTGADRSTNAGAFCSTNTCADSSTNTSANPSTYSSTDTGANPSTYSSTDTGTYSSTDTGTDTSAYSQRRAEWGYQMCIQDDPCGCYLECVPTPAWEYIRRPLATGTRCIQNGNYIIQGQNDGVCVPNECPLGYQRCDALADTCSEYCMCIMGRDPSGYEVTEWIRQPLPAGTACVQLTESTIGLVHGTTSPAGCSGSCSYGLGSGLGSGFGGLCYFSDAVGVIVDSCGPESCEDVCYGVGVPQAAKPV